MTDERIRLLSEITQNEIVDFVDKYQSGGEYQVVNDGEYLYAKLPFEEFLNGEFTVSPTYEQEQAEGRREEFESKFFFITGFGWYRKQPKGYSSAIESLNTAFNVVTVLQSLPADNLLFYIAPDFSDVAQCTEDWLSSNSFKNEAMTVQEFALFYRTAITIWNTTEH